MHILMFLNTHPFIGYGLASARLRSAKMELFEMLSILDLFGNAVLLLSCRRVKTEYFDHAGITASICLYWGMRMDL